MGAGKKKRKQTYPVLGENPAVPIPRESTVNQLRHLVFLSDRSRLVCGSPAVVFRGGEEGRA